MNSKGMEDLEEGVLFQVDQLNRLASLYMICPFKEIADTSA